jgi:mevalonate pyrophosphate decarboxylase
MKATLSGYTSNLIYDEYKSCIDYIKDNTSKLYENIDNTIDYTNPTITSEILGSLLSVLLSLSGAYNKDTLMKVFDADKTIFDENTVEKLNKKLTSFIEGTKTVDFKFKKMKERKNSNPISFNVSSTEEITDPSIVTQVTNLNSKKVPTIEGKLNYYRNGA